mmetsp:Transcript_90452/g.193972  ORF Transcript_90452/g.193972 Transcript_90452/m.193972 type:complete len:383 (-) Transcript_90452:111-1259(-)
MGACVARAFAIEPHLANSVPLPSPAGPHWHDATLASHPTVAGTSAVASGGLAVLAVAAIRRRWNVRRGATISRRAAAKPKRPRRRGFGAAPPASGAKHEPETSSTGGRSRVAANAPDDAEVRAIGAAVLAAIDQHGNSLVEGLRERGWWASDGPVLPPRLRGGLRGEVEALWTQGRFEKSRSIRGTEYYDKEHVYATEISSDKYDIAPRLAHYTVNATRALAARVNEAFPEVELSDQYLGNKLNLCTGKGAHFKPHLDINVAEKPFNRKLTLLLYLNAWRSDLGGELCILGEGASEEDVALDTGTAAAGLPAKLAPTSGRWVAFWSDRMLHGVADSQAPGGLPDYRASYTLWLCSRDSAGAAPGRSTSNGGFEAAPTFARQV